MTELRKELYDFYLNKCDKLSENFQRKIYGILDGIDTSGMNGYERKTLQYKTIAEHCEPVFFENSPFYFEMGTLAAVCDGCGEIRGHKHAGNWNWERSYHLFEEKDTVLFRQLTKQAGNLLYLICGPYADTRQHFIFNMKPVFAHGLRGIYEEAQKQLADATGEEADFLKASMQGLLCLKQISERFAQRATERLKSTKNELFRANLERIADSASKCPWEKPASFYEALNALGFCRLVCGSLEGVGYNTFGRVDVELLPFYENDIKSGVLTRDEAFELIRDFLLMWDCRYDHDMPMVGYADHELENTYVLGGCDSEGKCVWNDLTEMFIRATREEKIIFPKIKIRYSANSPKEYLDAVDEDVIHSTSVIIYENDDAIIPALTANGASLEDARDYIVTGCWGLSTNGNIMDDHGNYVNLLKAFEYSIHNRTDKMEECELYLKPIDEAKSFDEVYNITLENFNILFKERNRMTLLGKPTWHEADPLPMTSSTMVGCLEKRKDLTNGGCKYTDEHYQLVGLPNIVDSLLAIKTLCFDKKEVTLNEMLAAVRANWVGYERLRLKVLKCPFWGDGTRESSELAQRLNSDMFDCLSRLKTLWEGGKIFLGHLTYTEIRFWAEQTLATPDGRHNGEYFSQGLTPSRLHYIDSVTRVINSLKYLDNKLLAGNTVVNIILPITNITLDTCEAFLRATAKSAMMSLQLNCVSKEDLLDAQIHPEEHKDLIVRVCGFSARFTSLSEGWQAEVLSRNFYEN